MYTTKSLVKHPLAASQYGYTASRSTETALLHLVGRVERLKNTSLGLSWIFRGASDTPSNISIK
jgi:hypothetical protein